MITSAVAIEQWDLIEPFEIARGVITASSLVTLTLTDSAGHVGRAEAAGVDYDGETPHMLQAQIESVLPLVMAITMLWQMQLTPKTGDPVQQRMFMFMPLIFILFAYNFASALSLYWTTQNLISIIQLYVTRNKPLPVLEKKAVGQKKALEAGKGKKRRSGS